MKGFSNEDIVKTFRDMNIDSTRGIVTGGGEAIVLTNPDKYRILGDRSDLESFKNFVNSGENNMTIPNTSTTQYQQGGQMIVSRKGVRKNEDGSESTHLMKREYIDGKGWVAFPSLFQKDKLVYTSNFLLTHQLYILFYK